MRCTVSVYVSPYALAVLMTPQFITVTRLVDVQNRTHSQIHLKIHSFIQCIEILSHLYN